MLAASGPKNRKNYIQEQQANLIKMKHNKTKVLNVFLETGLHIQPTNKNRKKEIKGKIITESHTMHIRKRNRQERERERETDRETHIHTNGSRMG